MRRRGGPYIAAAIGPGGPLTSLLFSVDSPGGPLSWGDHRQRDSSNTLLKHFPIFL